MNDVSCTISGRKDREGIFFKVRSELVEPVRLRVPNPYSDVLVFTPDEQPLRCLSLACFSLDHRWHILQPGSEVVFSLSLKPLWRDLAGLFTVVCKLTYRHGDREICQSTEGNVKLDIPRIDSSERPTKMLARGIMDLTELSTIINQDALLEG